MGFIHLACFESIWDSGRVVNINVPWCALGLVVHGQPDYKNTPSMASSTLFIEPFRGLTRICPSHGTLDGRCDETAKAKFAQAWPREMCHTMRIGIQSLIRQLRRSCLVRGSDACYPADVMAPCRRRRGRLRKHLEGIVSRHGVTYGCPACMRRLHKLHPAHARNGEPPLLCKLYRHAPSKWSCEARLGVRPAGDPEHILIDGCGFAGGGVGVARRVEKQLGQRTGSGPRRDPATPAAGVADGDPIIYDNIELDRDIEPDSWVVIEDETHGVLRGDGHEVATQEGKGCDTLQNVQDTIGLMEETQDIDGLLDRLSPVTVRGQRVAKARRILCLNKGHHPRGGQADQAAAEDHIITIVSKALQLLRHPDESIAREALHRLHVKW